MRTGMRRCPSVVSAGIDIGSATRRQMPNSEQPSIRAASSSSFGRVMKNWRRKKIE